MNKVRAAFKGERREQLLIGVSERFPASRPIAHRLTPQPSAYRPDDSRLVRRHGLRFRLRPRHYFQWHHLFKREDAVLEELLRFGRGKRTFADVGANVGLYSLVVRKSMAADARVLSVEPSRETAEALREHVAWAGLERVEVVECALGERSGRVWLYERPDDWGKATLASRDGIVASREVEVTTLDQLLHDHGFASLDLLKIDVEGHELEVLKGARSTIESHQPTVFLEYSPQWMSEAAIAELAAYLRSLVQGGYRARCMAGMGWAEFSLDQLERATDQLNLVLVSPSDCALLDES